MYNWYMYFEDVWRRSVRFTQERFEHIESSHPEMLGQSVHIAETLKVPDFVIGSKTDESVELFYKLYSRTPVTTKYMCVVVKRGLNDEFVVTAYFTDRVKKGELLWRKP